MTLLPSEALSAVDCGHGTQALLVRTYLQRDRRPPASRGEVQAIRMLESDPRATSPLPDTVRAAMAFIDAHAADSITLTEIAAAAQLSPRALQVAFRRHLDTTPVLHLREVRLSRVHADLQSAVPGDGQTVSAVASRWGFSQLSRFARDYKQRYGVSPRQTLAGSAS